MGSHDPQLQFRLKSERRRKRLQKEDFEKKLLKLYTEKIRLRKQIDDLGYEPLIPPYQSGWKRMFVMREDLKKHSNAPLFDNILKKINTTEYSDRKDFTKKGRKRGRKIRIPRIQKLRFFYDHEKRFKEMSENERFYFRENIIMSKTRVYIKVYEFVEAWRFKLEVVPNMITKVIIKDNLLEQREAQIMDYFEQNNLWPKVCRLLDGSYNIRKFMFDEKLKYKNPLRNKSLHKILDEQT